MASAAAVERVLRAALVKGAAADRREADPNRGERQSGRDERTFMRASLSDLVQEALREFDLAPAIQAALREAAIVQEDMVKRFWHVAEGLYSAEGVALVAAECKLRADFFGALRRSLALATGLRVQDPRFPETTERGSASLGNDPERASRA